MDRTRVLAESARAELFDGGTIGNAGGVLVDGTVRATWRLDRHSRGAEAMRIEPLDRLPADERASVEAEASRLLGFLSPNGTAGAVSLGR